MGTTKIRKFKLISKWGFTFVSSSCQKLELKKTRYFRDFFQKQYFGSEDNKKKKT
jgi:hypothetical protein